MAFPLDLLKQYLSLKPGPEEDAGAFQQEAVEHLTSLYNFALGLAKNEDDAADLVQETYLRALRFRHRFQLGTNLRAWLFKILRNVFIDSYWRRRREPAMEDLEANGGSATVTEAEGVRGADAGPLNRLVRVDLNEALEQLRDPFRTAILLSDVEGLSVEEIAGIMDCPKNTVKTRLFRGRQLLRKLLTDYGS
jgi:RNA polymerase sigma-70 factor (ECF subfamily)